MVGSIMWAHLVHKWPQHTGKLIAAAMLAWSSIVLLTRTASIILRHFPNLTIYLALCFNFAGIMAARLFLGLLESVIGPVFVIVTSNWWTRPEQAFRTAFWLGGTPVRTFLTAFCIISEKRSLSNIDWKFLRWYPFIWPWFQ